MIRMFGVLLLIWSTTCAIAETLADGARIYNEGVLPDGTVLSASVAGGAVLSGKMAACARCHRPSGYGSAEGDLSVPDITASTLGSPLEPRRDRLFRELYQERQGAVAKSRAKTPRLRPRYAGTADLQRALAHGVDPAGRTLSPSMPRYALDTGSTAALSKYLAELGRLPDAGIDVRAVHFATILGPNVTPGRATALLEVTQAFVAIRNREIARELSRPDFSPYQKALYAPSRREWRLHVWRLNGPPQTWQAQLRQYYLNQPVFAVLGGAAEGDWTPIQSFCEATRVPCLFPLTQWPALSPGHFTIYLSKGLPQEAEMIATRLAKDKVHVVATLHDTNVDAQDLARLTTTALVDSGITVTENLKDAEALVILGNEDFVQKTLSEPAVTAFARSVVVSGGLLSSEGAPNLRPPRPLLIAWRYAQPTAVPQRIYRLRGWLRARRVRAPDWERTQLNTLLTLDAAKHAMDHLVDRYSRELFIETIEHQLETGLNPGTFPRMSLGPDQRFAARGGGILTLYPNGDLVTQLPNAQPPR